MPGHDPRTLPDDGFFGFGVYTGTGCFYDAAAARALAPLVEGLDRDGEVTAEVTDEKSGANLIAFIAGQGDGAYPTWIGRTAAGDIACFVADVLPFDTITVRNIPVRSLPGGNEGGPPLAEGAGQAPGECGRRSGELWLVEVKQVPEGS